jgi:ABC-type dipeptide/oligopeptide/nickel transport system ATPase component
MAVMHRPALLIVDEPTSALDVVSQAQILKLFKSLNREYGVSILYISHDLLSVASLCSRIYVLRNGAIVESGSTETVFSSPRHPYSRSLIEALPIRAFELG